MEQEVTDQDEFGFDLEPVTAPSSEQEGHTEPAQPEKVPAKEVSDDGEGKGAAQKLTNSDAKDKRIEIKKTKITQEEWQSTQERLAAQDAEIAQIRLEKDQATFEAKNPIVTSEKYQTKWEELCKAKANPEHKYHRLDFSDLRQLLIGEEEKAENIEAMEEYETSQIRTVTPPTFSKSTTPIKTPGGVDAETYGWLKAQGYTDEQIADSDNISLSR